jgi:transposase
MTTDYLATELQTAVRVNDTKLFASLELSKSRWLVTVSAPGSEKLSKHVVIGGDGGALLNLLGRLRAAAERRGGMAVQVVVIQEAGLDGFWLHRLLEANEIESHVVDPASIAVDRRHRRAKTDVIDGEMLLRTLMAWARGERRVCSMVRPPSPDEEDRRRLTRERGTLLNERTRHTNRIKGLLAGQGITDYDIHSGRIVWPVSTHSGPGMGAACRNGSRRRSAGRSSGSTWSSRKWPWLSVSATRWSA